MSKNLFLVETETLSRGYSLANEIEKIASVEIYDLSHNGIGGSYIFGRIDQNETDLFEKIIEGSRDFVVFDEKKLPLKEALYGLKSQEVSGCLGVLESETISCNVRLLLNLEHIELLEISSGQGMGGRSIAFFNSETANLTIDKTSEKNLIDAKIIEEPGPFIKKLFQYT